MANKTEYHLFDDQKSIQDSVFTEHIDYVMFFKDSVRGLQPGAPVEFRGIRLGHRRQSAVLYSGAEAAFER
ncbi:paraquat-inducible protein B [Klebsiella pneumoniae]|uniref:Paraquat-inducible protein B n=1 Tax=Klebsiella pneumoniae TaxID=573 RepID=A0A447S4Y0_KLEPN|nr:paraquat-inducible protein B [Klebsiella pneumoniae]